MGVRSHTFRYTSTNPEPHKHYSSSSTPSFIGACISSDHISLVYDFVSGANLFDCLRNKNLNFTVVSSWKSGVRSTLMGGGSEGKGTFYGTALASLFKLGLRAFGIPILR
ncbi:hypothetical protein QN277_024887 [Acacia crassicarpa]|uniref:Uncharacterized protein n=1 Tax=Acacia crassicarpa TaxID=499986 RepID=A0AAE1JFS7_9FABA|nr:hypothetical protein QN277_024887 [Acacia crassicarpa]